MFYDGSSLTSSSSSGGTAIRFALPLAAPEPDLDLPARVIALWQQHGSMTAQQFSLAVSEIAGRPVLVVDLEAMPHAPTGRGTNNHTEAWFTPDQLKDRAAYLQRLALETHPEAEDIWNAWEWEKVSACVCAPNIDELSVMGGAETDLAASMNMPSRLVGACWDKAAIIFSPDERWTPVQEWQNLTGLREEMEHCPPDALVRAYTVAHETGHALQKRKDFDRPEDNGIQTQKDKHLIEWDADDLPITGMRQLARSLNKQALQQNLQGEALAANRAERRALLENAQGIKMMRALNGFLSTSPRYWISLAQDNPQKLGLLPIPDNQNAESVSRFFQAADKAAEKSILANYELRWRVAAQIEGNPLTENSTALQCKIKDWLDNPGPCSDNTSHRWELNYWFSDFLSLDKKAKNKPQNSFYWGGVNDVKQSIPALRQVVESGLITDPLTLRTAELVMRAAYYFKPSLRPASTAPIAVSRQHLATPTIH